MSTSLTTKQYFNQEGVKNKFHELLGEKSVAFVTSVMQVVNNNDLLKRATPASIYNAAAMAAVLDMPINNNLGFAYIVPYAGQAQFQIGYKGFIQLAIRSGQYETIGAAPIYKGQLTSNNPLTGFEFDFNIPKSGEPIGYAAHFKLKSGFSKTLYMTTEELLAHGKRYSKSFTKNGSIWKKDFPGMAQKTVLKMLLSKYGVLSLDMQTAVQSDQSIVKDFENGKFEYPDNAQESAGEETVDATAEVIESKKPAEMDDEIL